MAIALAIAPQAAATAIDWRRQHLAQSFSRIWLKQRSLQTHFVSGTSMLAAAISFGASRKATQALRLLWRQRRATLFGQWHPGSEFATNSQPPDTAPEGPDAEDAVQQHDAETSGEVDSQVSSYGNLSTHREMMEDEARTEAFREAIFRSCKDKVVLEIGCGTGILSVFAAQAGARHVIAVEANFEMVDYAHELVDSNGFSHKVSIVEGRVEEVYDDVDSCLRTTCDAAKVDVIISEWMGYMLVCEDMFPSVAFARERWLAQDGVMLPSSCKTWIAPFSHPALLEHISGYWGTRPYGVDMSALAYHALQQHLLPPVIDVVPQEQLLGKPALIFELNCRHDSGKATKQQELHFNFCIDHAGELHGFASWFTCELMPGVEFSTGPEVKATHWEQTLLFLDPSCDVFNLNVSPGDEISGEFRWLVHGYDMGVVIVGEVRRAEDQHKARRFGRRLVLNVN